LHTPRIHIGTSGWSYRHWKGIFYPPHVKTKGWLPYYAEHFTTTEINGSFYRVPAVETVAGWVAQTPPHFLFCPKMSRYLTHMKKLRDPEEPLQRFFDAFDVMKGHMGPVLLQLPPQLLFQYHQADQFFRTLTLGYPAYRFVLEGRHATWLSEDALTLLARWNIGWVISQSGVSFPYSEMVTAENIYVRFHGPEQLYASGYSEEQLKVFAEKFLDWERQGHTVWAYFNNDIHGFAPKDALNFARLLGVQKTGAQV
jgi:uncharacterized protein YecE (DUF72 family)